MSFMLVQPLHTCIEKSKALYFVHLSVVLLDGCNSEMLIIDMYSIQYQ